MNIPPKRRDNGIRIGVEEGHLVVIIHGEGVRLPPEESARFAHAVFSAALAMATQNGAMEAVGHMCPDCTLKYSRAMAEQAAAQQQPTGERTPLIQVQ